MGDRITFYMLSAKGAPPRTVTAPRSLIAAIALFSLAILAALSAGAYDYYHLKTASLRTHRLQAQLDVRDDELSLQRQQIQNFAKEINALKSRLLALGEFERQIRVVAGLQIDDREGGLGIGGPFPRICRRPGPSPGSTPGWCGKCTIRWPAWKWPPEIRPPVSRISSRG